MKKYKQQRDEAIDEKDELEKVKDEEIEDLKRQLE